MKKGKKIIENDQWRVRCGFARSIERSIEFKKKTPIKKKNLPKTWEKNSEGKKKDYLRSKSTFLEHQNWSILSAVHGLNAKNAKKNFLQFRNLGKLNKQKMKYHHLNYSFTKDKSQTLENWEGQGEKFWAISFDLVKTHVATLWTRLELVGFPLLYQRKEKKI